MSDPVTASSRSLAPARPALATQPAPIRPLERILAAVEHQAAYRAECVGLVPTENLLSPAARGVMGSDLGHRYLFQNPQWRYVGGKHLAEVETLAQELARDLFGARHADGRPLPGENCTNIVIHTVLRPGGTFYHLAMEDGGHFAARSVAARLTADLRQVPYDAANATLDLAGCARAFEAAPPDVIYLDASMVLFAHPVRELRSLAGPDAIIVYDASQVLGLLAGGIFQDPLREGADVVSGSTHKSLPGPQKGLILTNRDDIAARVEATIFPGHVSNFHLHHVAALAVTLAEAQEYGAAYARQTVANARARGLELARLGLAVQGGERVTDSHQVWLDASPLATPDEAVEALHEVNLIANVNLIPSLRRKGLRLGTPEVTRLGMREPEMARLAALLHATLTGAEPPGQVRERVTDLARRFRTVQYCHPGADRIGAPANADAA